MSVSGGLEQTHHIHCPIHNFYRPIIPTTAAMHRTLVASLSGQVMQHVHAFRVAQRNIDFSVKLVTLILLAWGDCGSYTFWALKVKARESDAKVSRASVRHHIDHPSQHIWLMHITVI